MNFWTILLIAISLCMDTLALSISIGLVQKNRNYGLAVKVGIIFGIVQFLTPILGWYAGNLLADVISVYDHWIACILLTIIGGKMIYEAIHGDEKEKEKEQNIKMTALMFIAIVTSIDALAVGVSFAFLNEPILYPATVIGIVTFIIAFTGVLIGHLVGKYFQSGVEIFGGLILIGIGIKILVEDLYFS